MEHEDLCASRWTAPFSPLTTNSDACVVDGHIITNDEIVAFCANPPLGTRLVEWPYSSPYKFSPTLLVKPGATRVEIENQQSAAKLLHPAIIRVPRVCHYFEHQEPYHGIMLGYILMEFIPGQVKSAETLENEDYEKLTNLLLYFQGIRRDFPGTLTLNASGRSYNPPFDEDGVELGGRVEEMEKWFYTRLFKRQRISFTHSEFVFCHRDFAPRNIIWCQEGSIGLVDWASAGFYPLTFRFAHIEPALVMIILSINV